MESSTTMHHRFYLYILSNRSKMIYVGLTNDLKNILKKHQEMRMSTSKGNFGLNRLVHVEEFDNVEEAIQREEELKKAPRSTKARLLSFVNPKWRCIQNNWFEAKEPQLIKSV